MTPVAIGTPLFSASVLTKKDPLRDALSYVAGDSACLLASCATEGLVLRGRYTRLADWHEV